MKHLVLATAVLASVGSAAAAAPLPVAPQVAAGVVNRDAYPPREVSFPGGVKGLPDLSYSGNSGFRQLKLDLYLPPASFRGPRPVVVYTHGGGWAGGTPRTTAAYENWPQILASLASKGYVVASLHYRLSGEAPFPAAIQDVKAAIRWLRGNAAAYNIDKNRFLTWGPSAGGQLAALAATSCGVAALLPPAPRPPGGAARPVESAGAAPPPESECVQGSVGWYGVYDFVPLEAARRPAPGAPAPAEDAYLGCAPGSCTADQIRLPSPAAHIDPSDPPFLLIHGVNDRTVAVAQAQGFHDALVRAGVKSELVLLPGIDHSWIGATPEATRAASIDALQRTFDFIDATIGDR